MTLPASGPLTLSDIQTEFGGTNPIGMNEYYAGGGLVPAGTSGTYGTVPSSGALSVQNFYGTSQFVPQYIEDVFNTYLYTGNDTTQVITNGIDLATKGGMVWVKGRSGATNHTLVDTARGTSSGLITNTTDTAGSSSGFTSFDTTGFTFGGGSGARNNNGTLYVTWTFRKQPKFFDVVTYTGNGNSTSRNISHSLGSVAGTIIVKRTDSTSNWAVAAYDGTNWKVGTTTTPFALNLTNASTFDVGSVATSTTFNVCRMQWSSGGNPTDDFNANGATYVAYLFAHDAGGFGLTGTNNVISCGSFSTTAAANYTTTVNLGYEPQWILMKSTGATGNWFLFDNMRGMPVTYPTEGNYQGRQALCPNLNNAEFENIGPEPTATGFTVRANEASYIYIAIRRGPMKVPTLGTTVFSPTAVNNAQGTDNTTGFPLDMQIMNIRSGYGANGVLSTRLMNVSSNTTSSGSYLRTPSTSIESGGSDITRYWSNTGFQTASNWGGSGMIYWSFSRAPSVFDVVCYTGTGSATTFTHNLGVVPELIITKVRAGGPPDFGWAVYASPLGATKALFLDTTDAEQTLGAYWNDTAPTSSVFTVGNANKTNRTSYTYVAYLFATCAGVSKVGSYTGNGTTQTINCSFTTGARFVLIKRIDSTGGWYVYDTARGMTTLTDPYLFMNSTAAEVATLGSVTTVSTGFALNAAVLAAINASGGSYIFLAIA